MRSFLQIWKRKVWGVSDFVIFVENVHRPSQKKKKKKKKMEHQSWKALRNCLSFSSFLHHFSGITGKKLFGAKCYFTDLRTANIIQLFVAIKGNFSGLFFFWTCRCEGEFLRDVLINVAPAYLHIFKTENW